MALHLKSTLFALAAMVAASTGPVAAQEYSIAWDPRSGDAWVDSQLADVNRYGLRYREPFVDEMVRYYSAPRGLVTELLVTRRWAPGDVYYACAIAQTLGRPCRYVADEWQRNHGKGWGEVAGGLGIKPGSAEFHRLKRGFVPTYDRWARPVDIDRDLRKDFPGRAKAGNGRGAASTNGKPPAHSPASPARAGAHGPGRSKENAKDGKANRGKDRGIE